MGATTNRNVFVNNWHVVAYLRRCSGSAMDAKTAIAESGKRLGYDQLKSKQTEAMTSFLDGNDTFVSLPTGYGKSIIYAALPCAFDLLKGNGVSISLSCLDCSVANLPCNCQCYYKMY